MWDHNGPDIGLAQRGTKLVYLLSQFYRNKKNASFSLLSHRPVDVAHNTQRDVAMIR